MDAWRQGGTEVNEAKNGVGWCRPSRRAGFVTGTHREQLVKPRGLAAGKVADIRDRRESAFIGRICNAGVSASG